MRNRCLIGLVSGAALLTAGLIVLVGCGGGGGPITPPVVPPGPSLNEQFVALMDPVQRTASYIGTERCLDCHGDGGTAATRMDEARWNATDHARLSVGCEQCHGPGGAHQAAPTNEAAILATPTIATSVVCAQCHGPTMAQFEASAHAHVVEDVIETAKTNPAGEKLCMRCHSAPTRATYVDNTLKTAAKSPDEIEADLTGLTNDQVVALAHISHESATCANCHDPHYPGKTTWKGQDRQLLRSDTNTDLSVIGQPGTLSRFVITYDHTCAVCHTGGTSRTADGRDAALTSGTARPNMHDNPQFYMLMGLGGSELPGSGPIVRRTAHADAPGQCSHCHMPNGNHAMMPQLDVSCQPCHTAEDAAARSAIRGEIQVRLFALRTRMENWAKATHGDTAMWDYTTSITAAGKTPPAQAQVPIEIKRARHNFYFVVRDLSYGFHNPAYTRYLLEIANANLDALGVSRSAPPTALTPEQAASLEASRKRASMADLLR